MESAKNSRAALVQRVAKTLAGASTLVPERSRRALSNRVAAASQLAPKAAETLAAFREALENDLATPKALSVLQTSLKDSELSNEDKIALVSRMDDVFALNLIADAKDALQTARVQITADSVNAAEIEALIQKRTEAKKVKNYTEADRIRNELKEKGIVLEDTSSGTMWKQLK
jgi:cysteinyl-tRNA synthetase